MSELAESLLNVLEATGYLSAGRPAASSVTLAGSDDARTSRYQHTWHPSFAPDAWWRSNPESEAWGGSAVDLTVYFKFVEEPAGAAVAEWQKEVWNRGFSPLLWVVSPERVDLYNGFAHPRAPSEATENRLDTFQHLESKLAELDTLAGRLAMETGEFWRQNPHVDRSDSVDRRLLKDLTALERDLVHAGLVRDEAQGLIGRSIFTKYLTDRGIVTEQHLDELCGFDDLADILSDRAATQSLFEWLRERFNGDMFSSSPVPVPDAEHLQRVARFLKAEEPDGQLSLFPYRFDVIPVELISSIYEQFAHSEAADASTGSGPNAAKHKGVYYTPLAAVSLLLDEVLNGLTGNETVLDLTCGSGVFLVEALRRLVHLKSAGRPPSRQTIRNTLYQQVYGVDSSEAAVRVAAFSLYLAALELDPDPQPPHALRFEPLEGQTLLVGDAWEIDKTPAGQEALTTENGLRQFDVIVGNPPWSFKGKAGTAARRARSSGRARSPRGESLDFVERATDFAHERTRFGVIVNATPFFSRSRTGIDAARAIVESLSPVTLVNLAELSRWLFPRANMPAMALLARHREQPAEQMTLVQARWSPAGERSHTIELAPGDVTALPLASWKRNAGLFKAVFLGCRHDLLLLDKLWEKYDSLEARLGALGTNLKTGLIFGNRSQNATFLSRLPLAGSRDIDRFAVSDSLSMLGQEEAERPRELENYRAPLLLVKEFMRGGPRLVTAVSERDIVFTDSFFGISFAENDPDTACLISGILSSTLASWYFLMTGSAFGLWMRRLKRADVLSIPIPDLEAAVKSDAGMQLVRLVRAFHCSAPNEEDWESLDDAVSDLYELSAEDRIVVRDGLFQASWQWEPGRLDSVAPAGLTHLEHYARAFLGSMDAWFSVSNRRRMRAELFTLPENAPLRVVRFVIEDAPGPSELKPVSPEGTLREVLTRIGESTRMPITGSLVGLSELRVHAEDEVTIIKPAARRHWMGICGLEDADAVVRDSVRGGFDS